MKLGSALDKKREVIIARFERYFEATKDAIVQGIGPDSFEKYATVSLEEYAKRCVEAFKKFLDRTILRLQNKDQVSALAERFQSGVVPDFWDDFEAYRDFKDSFFSSLFLVQTSDGGSHAAVAKSILNKLQIDPNVNLDVSEETIEEAFEAYLEKSDGWKDEYWPLGDA